MKSNRLKTMLIWMMSLSHFGQNDLCGVAPVTPIEALFSVGGAAALPPATPTPTFHSLKNDVHAKGKRKTMTFLRKGYVDRRILSPLWH